MVDKLTLLEQWVQGKGICPWSPSAFQGPDALEQAYKAFDVFSYFKLKATKRRYYCSVLVKYQKVVAVMEGGTKWFSIIDLANAFFVIPTSHFVV